MGNTKLVNVHLGRVIALVVVASLEVALGTIEIISAELLEALSVDANRELVLLIANLICEACVDSDLVNWGTLLRAGRAGVDTKVELALGVEIKLSNWLV